MTPAADTDERFTPEAFFAATRRALHAEPPSISDPVGDHSLNPDMLLEPAVYKDAAVLIPVIAHETGVTVLLTQRTAHLSSHAGQIAFPGARSIRAMPAPPRRRCARRRRRSVSTAERYQFWAISTPI